MEQRVGLPAKRSQRTRVGASVGRVELAYVALPTPSWQHGDRETQREREKHPIGRENRRLELLKAAQGFLIPWLSGRK